MKTASFVLLNAVLGALAAPTQHRRRDTKEYDIVMAPSADVAATLATLNLNVDMQDIFATYNNSHFRGFSGAITADEVATLNAMPEVMTVGEVVEISIAASRTTAPWGLQRISQAETISSSKSTTARTYTYTYSDTDLGDGVDVYIIDTGIYVSHSEFGSRASMGFTYFTSNTDGNGHGTHCAGTIGGSTVGVASKANLIGVKVLRDSGSGTSTSLLAGFDYVAAQHSAKSSSSGFVGSVASMSLGFNGRSTSVETALKNLVAAGVHAAVAAGNDAADACDYSPAAIGGSNSAVVTVGAANIDDSVSYFSNSGSCVDVYAPGESVVSSYNTGTSAYATLSGTSMATPHVAGLIAYYLAGSSGLTPAQMKAKVIAAAIDGVLSTDDNPDYVSGGDLIIVNNGST
ncbi:putative peptidase s8 s53 subtilisin kexin sedolisin protein [Neofusicoccum parvum UCRNP2]|uniref:Peptidase S8/S53 domain-containing protein n=3 Tax=Neofusicoccum TaxID=407951 RepID=A0ABR3SU50_9PEZI|nr:putative peptidase s8 s53 subtilisin kexin sedolisin protein [Neofusicoccum parvum UCRNP2]GME45082.1 subtilisin-like protein [Neofusicoccum parvum]